MPLDYLLCATIGLVCVVLAMDAAEGAPARGDEFLVPSRGAFLRCLDLGKPELAPVKVALEKGDLDAAEAAYLGHFRSKPIRSPLLTDWSKKERNSGYNTKRADDLLAGHFWDGYSVHEVPETGLDWHKSPLSCVTRFPIFGTLRYAIHHTQDPKYVRFVVDHLLEYMEAYPIEEFVGKRTTEGWTNHTTVAKPWYWCMIPNRLRELPHTIALIRSVPEVRDDELLRIVRRLYQETAYLRTEIGHWVERRHNGGCAMIEAMALCCAVLDEFSASREWLAYDAELAAQYIGQAFYPDGMCVELTAAYSASVSSVQQRLAYALREQEAIKALRGRLAAMVTCMVALSDPTGWLPSFGDLHAGTLPRCVHQPLAEWLGLPWVGTVARRTDGPLPPFKVWPVLGQDQWCGYYTMRSDWSPDAKYMAIDAGPWGTTHQHGDRLSFVVTANGAKFIIDPSSTKYASNRPDAFIGGQPSGFLHNTITVDGVDEFRSEGTIAEAKQPLRNTWQHGERHTLFASSFSFAPVKPVTWERRVLFADGSYWLLQDVITGQQDTAEIEQNFQFEADIQIEFHDGTSVATTPNGARLALVPLAGSLTPKLTIGDKTPHTTYWPNGKPTKVLRREDGHDQMHGRGWTGRSSHKLIPAPAVTYTGKVELPVMITVAIIPLAPNQDLADAPQIRAEVAEGKTIWIVPAGDGVLRFVTSVGACSVSEGGAE